MDIRQVLELVGRSGSNATLGQLLLTIPPADRSLFELQVMKLAREGIVELSKKLGGDYYVHVKSLPARTINQVEKDKKAQMQIHTTGLVVTLPSSLYKDFGVIGGGSAETHKVFRSLLQGATNYVKLCLPFPEEAGSSYFADEIKGLARSGVMLKLLTREVFAQHKYGSSYGNLVKALRRIYDIYSSCGDRTKIEIRDFHVGLQGSGFDMVHYESVHAKIILADGLHCYTGSGEWRINSLYNNFELGVVLGGQSVTQVEAFFDLVWNHAKPVPYAFLKGMTKLDGAKAHLQRR